jgi:hypothetical protein
MGWGHLKILFFRTTEPEELIFTGKLSDLCRFKFIQIMVLRVRRGHNNENHIFTCVYIEKNLLL